MIANDFTAWQYEIAIVASRFKLGLLSPDGMIYFTNVLMNQGYYDNLMLDILDDNPLFSFDEESKFIKRNFIQLWQNLKLPNIATEQAKWLITFDTLVYFSVRPFYPDYFEIEILDYYLYEKYNDILIDTQDIKEKYLSFVDICYSDEATNEEINNIDVGSLYILCEAWVNSHQPKILTIMHQLFPKNLRE